MRTRKRLDVAKVGYGNPPEHSRFKPGKSGNPSGRPKGTLNLKTDLEKELKSALTIREDGRSARFSKQRVTIKVLVDKSLKGDLKAIQLLLKTLDRHLPPDEEPIDEGPSRQYDDAILEQALRRIRGVVKTSSAKLRDRRKTHE